MIMGRRKPTYEDLEKKISDLEKKLEQYKDLDSKKLSPPKNDKSEVSRTANDFNSIKNKFWLLADSSPIAMYQTDSKGSCIYVNKKWRELTGLSFEEALGDGWQKGLHPEDRDLILQSWKKYAKGLQPWSLEYRFQTPEGKINWVYGTSVSLRDEKGNITGFLGTNIDLTEQKLLEKENISNINKYKNLYRSTPALMHSTNNKGEIIDVSNRWLKELGYSLNEVIGKKSVDFLTKESREIALTKHFPIFWEVGYVEDIEYQLIKKDGSIIDVLLSATTERDEKGQINRTLAIFQDITEKKKDREAILQSEKRYQNLFHNSPVPLWEEDISDLTGYLNKKKAEGITDFEKFFDDNPEELFYCSQLVKIIDVNDATLKLHKADTKQNLLGNLNKIFTEKSHQSFKNEVIELANGKTEIETEGETKTFDGEIRNVLLKLLIDSNKTSAKKAIVATLDITDRVLAEKALLESEERFDLAMKATKDGIYDWDLLTDGIYYSPGWKKMLGYEDHELENKFSVWENLTHPEDLKKSWEMLKDYLDGKLDRLELEFKMKHKDGHWIDILSRAHAIFDDNGKPVRVIGTHVDVTEQKKILKSLEQERKRSQHYLDVAGVMLIAIDKNKKITLINPKGCEILGYSCDEIIGENWFSKFLPKENIEEVKHVFDQIISGEVEAVKYYENPIIRKDGTKRTIAWHNSLLEDDSGNVTGLFSSGTDITERIESENIIIEERERASNILQGTNAGTWEWHIQTGELILDDQWASILGYKLHELKPISVKTWENKVHPEDMPAVQKIVEKHFNRETDYYDAEFRMAHKNGSWIWINARGKTVEWTNDNKPLRMSGVHIDINQRKIAEKELVKAKEKAEESDRLKSAFMANMSHEIRTPMNGILGFADLLKEPQLSPNQQLRYINVIQKSGQRMLSIINDLIDISKIEAGQMEVEISETNVNETIEYLYSFFKPEAIEKGLHLFYKMELPKYNSVIETDREKLLAILSNLLKNAIKYTNSGNIKFGYSIKSGHIEFYVQDTGIGIPKEHHEIIFERFTQADMSITKPYEGAGLGLSISKAYIELLGGKIWLESTPQEGTSFFFTLPFSEKKTKEEVADQPFSVLRETDSLQNMVILVAEDDEVASIYLSEILKSRCKKLIQVNNGVEAIEAVKANGIDLILMDMKMPQMDGYEATKLIRKINKDVVIIAQTAYALTDDREKALQAGCNEYISKPIKIKELLDLINSFIDN